MLQKMRMRRWYDESGRPCGRDGMITSVAVGEREAPGCGPQSGSIYPIIATCRARR